MAEIVLRELQKERNKESFEERLESFLKAPPDMMNKLWESVLETVRDRDQPWVKEVFRWILIANNMSIRDMKSAVEWGNRNWTFGDKFEEFERFLKFECGSLLRFIQLDDGETEIRLIHDTLRSLLFDQKACM